MPGSVYTGTAANLPRENRFGGTYQRTGITMDAATMCWVWLRGDVFTDALNSDGTTPCHSHPFDMTLFVLEGEMAFHADGKDYLLKAGDFIYVPRDVVHGGRSGNGEDVRIIEFFAPIRTDYLYVAEHQLGYNQAPRNADGSRVDTRSFREVVAEMGDSAPHTY